jgi:hypothetical protein
VGNPSRARSPYIINVPYLAFERSTCEVQRANFPYGDAFRSIGKLPSPLVMPCIIRLGDIDTDFAISVIPMTTRHLLIREFTYSCSNQVRLRLGSCLDGDHMCQCRWRVRRPCDVTG